MSQPGVQRRLAAIMAADVAGYSRLMGDDEEGTLAALTAHRAELIEIGAKVVRHGRCVTFQLAEVAIPQRLFAEILRLIDGLRPKPAPI